MPPGHAANLWHHHNMLLSVYVFGYTRLPYSIAAATNEPSGVTPSWHQQALLAGSRVGRVWDPS